MPSSGRSSSTVRSQHTATPAKETRHSPSKQDEDRLVLRQFQRLYKGLMADEREHHFRNGLTKDKLLGYMKDGESILEMSAKVAPLQDANGNDIVDKVPINMNWLTLPSSFSSTWRWIKVRAKKLNKYLTEDEDLAFRMKHYAIDDGPQGDADSSFVTSSRKDVQVLPLPTADATHTHDPADEAMATHARGRFQRLYPSESPAGPSGSSSRQKAITTKAFTIPRSGLSPTSLKGPTSRNSGQKRSTVSRSPESGSRSNKFSRDNDREELEAERKKGKVWYAWWRVS
ncbi:hypothetical protein FPCIR_6063 [Fusarium pseudocircinatum]|uniref:Uncharacterized protein n=1 Tax=Fusarium pseudocircinatum TaxID=56676 RepID=A0A8H5P7B5_9HYPO|nr:hypothetical protein FPCIR_6063 [Fusarium pseudocircinatum]